MTIRFNDKILTQLDAAFGKTIADSASAEYCSTFQCLSCVVCHRRDISVFHLYNMFYTIQTIYFLKALGPRISKLILPSVSCTNTQIQIHKYTNTAYDEVPERPNMWYIFEKRIVQGYQKLYSHVPNAQIQKYKYTNTQIQHMMKYQKDPICGIFLKRGLLKGIKNDTPMCQTCKYTNTNTQIQHMTKCQKDPTCGIFLIVRPSVRPSIRKKNLNYLLSLINHPGIMPDPS